MLNEISSRLCKASALTLTLIFTIIMCMGQSLAKSTYWDTSKEAASGVTKILQDLVNHWWLPVFLVGLVIFIFGSEKTKSIGKYIMIGTFILFVIANGTTILTNSFEALADLFNGSRAANTGSGG